MRKIIAWMLTAALGLSLGGCGKSELTQQKEPVQEQTAAESHIDAPAESEPLAAEEPKADTEPAAAESELENAGVYEAVLDGVHTVAVTGDEEAVDLEGMTGIWEATLGLESEQVLEELGYALTDISGDGLPELLVGRITERQDGECFGNEILCAYTAPEGEAQFVFAGWARSRHLWMGDGHFFLSGSSGAMYSMLGEFSLTEDGREIQWKDYYFTWPSTESEEKMDYYHNTTGTWEPDEAEQLEMTDEAFWQLWDGYQSRVENLPLTPLSEYIPAGNVTPMPASLVRAQWAEDVPVSLSSHDEYMADGSNAQSQVLLTVDETVRNFRFLSLALEEVAEDGSFQFSTHELYHQDTLSPDRPLLVGLTFAGDLPGYGISYEDENGEVCCFTLEISGMDGSLIMNPF